MGKQKKIKQPKQPEPEIKLSPQVLGRIRGEIKQYKDGGVAEEVISNLLKVKAKGLKISLASLNTQLESLKSAKEAKGVLKERRHQVMSMRYIANCVCVATNDAVKSKDKAGHYDDTLSQMVVSMWDNLLQTMQGWIGMFEVPSPADCKQYRDKFGFDAVAGDLKRTCYGWETATGRKPQYDFRMIPTTKTGVHFNPVDIEVGIPSDES